MRSLLRRLPGLWFGFSARVSRRAYAATGFGLAAAKYAVDVAVEWRATGTFWTPWDDLHPALSAPSPAGLGETSGLLLLLWTLPFLWIGASMTIRRALDAGLSPGWGLLFFVPVVN